MRYKTSLVLSLFAVCTIFLQKILSAFPSFVEQFYFNGLFQVLRVVYDYTLGMLPIPMIYIFHIGLFIFIYRSYKKARKAPSRKKTLLSVGHSIVSLISFILIVFYWSWGFNYQRIPIETHLGLIEKDAPTLDVLTQVKRTGDLLLQIKTSEAFKKQYDIVAYDRQYIEQQVREGIEGVLQEMDYPTTGKVRIRHVKPKGTLLRFSAAGIYLPFVFEGHIDPGLHPVTWPFTMCHEMGHGYGFTDEGTCNFLGFLGCLHQDDIFIQYSGWLGYFRYLLGNARKFYPEKYGELYKEIPAPVQQDLKDIQTELKKYPDLFPRARDVIYDSYLKSHGISEGLQNYNKIVRLVHMWDAKQKVSIFQKQH